MWILWNWVETEEKLIWVTHWRFKEGGGRWGCNGGSDDRGEVLVMEDGRGLTDGSAAWMRWKVAVNVGRWRYGWLLRLEGAAKLGLLSSTAFQVTERKHRNARVAAELRSNTPTLYTATKHEPRSLRQTRPQSQTARGFQSGATTLLKADVWQKDGSGSSW